VSDPITLRLLDIYRIGLGPSSSHTVGPMRATAEFRSECLAAGIVPDRLEVELMGSLSATGLGHGTDKAVLAGLCGWDVETCDVDAFRMLGGMLRVVPWGDREITDVDVRFLTYAEYKSPPHVKLISWLLMLNATRDRSSPQGAYTYIPRLGLSMPPGSSS